MAANPASFAMADNTSDIYFSAGFGKGKITGPKANLDFGIEEKVEKIRQHPFKVGKSYSGINHQPFHLVPSPESASAMCGSSGRHLR